MADQDSDPRLREAMAEMRAVAKKYDVGAHVVVNSKTHAEYAIMFPSWSMARLIPKPDGGFALHLKARTARHTDTEATVGMLLNIRDITYQSALILEKLHHQLAQTMDISHHPIIRPQDALQPEQGPEGSEPH